MLVIIGSMNGKLDLHNFVCWCPLVFSQKSYVLLFRKSLQISFIQLVELESTGSCAANGRIIFPTAISLYSCVKQEWRCLVHARRVMLHRECLHISVAGAMSVSARVTVMPQQSPLTIDQRNAHLCALLRGTASASQLHVVKQSSRPPPSRASIVHVYSLWTGPRYALH